MQASPSWELAQRPRKPGRRSAYKEPASLPRTRRAKVPPQRCTNTGGFLVGYRYSFNRWLAAEGVYGYDRNTQEYFAPAGFARVQANIDQATGGFVFRVPAPARFRFSPYLLAEGGALIFDPTGNAPSPASQLRNVRLPVCLPTALVPIFHFSGMSPCAPNIVVWCTAHRTLVWQRSIPMQSLIQRNRQRESYSGSERGNA